jgi:hypothetical protein
MDDRLIDLGKRLVACKGFAWMPGMAIVDDHGVRGYVVSVAQTLNPIVWAANIAGVSRLSAEDVIECLPDMSDPATRGCLLAVIRKDHSAPYAQVESDLHLGWRVWVHDVPITDWCSTEDEAMVLAMEFTP